MPSLDRSDFLTLAILFLAIAGLGATAATIDSLEGASGGSPPVSVDPTDGVGGIGDPSSNISNGETGDGATPDRQAVDLVVCVEFLQNSEVIFGIVAVVALFLFALARQFNPATSILVGAVLVPLIMGVYFFSTNCSTAGNGSSNASPGSSILSNEGGITSAPLPPAVVAGIFALVLVGGIAVLFTTTKEEETFEPIEEEAEPPETADFARAAGRAADRIEETNVRIDNAVYRAWLEMTSLLQLENPETVAPIDFVDAAVDVGLDRDDVEELTKLFNEVRYGGKSADVRENRALEILRHIEDTYETEAMNDGGEK